jgi:hypothetical protein
MIWSKERLTHSAGSDKSMSQTHGKCDKHACGPLVAFYLEQEQEVLPKAPVTLIVREYNQPVCAISLRCDGFTNFFAMIS